MSTTHIISEHHQIVPSIGKRIFNCKDIPRFGNSILHFDSHSDVGHIRTPAALKPDFLEEIDSSLSQLNIGNPFTLLFYYGFIDDFYWFSPGEICHEISQPFLFTVEHEWNDPLHFYKRKLISCLDNIFQSRALDKNFYRKVSVSSEENISYLLDSVEYALIDTGLRQIISGNKEYILDICLDYFYANDDHIASPIAISVTEDYYNDFLNDELHPLKLKMGPLARASVDEYGYQIKLGGFEQHASHLDNISNKIQETIDDRFYFFEKFLTSLKRKPLAIYICRSGISNYTPQNYISYIEEKLLLLLNQLFEVEVIDESKN